MFARIVYFIAIGWWFGLLMSLAGYLLCASIIGLPLGVILLNRLPTYVYLAEPGEPCELGYSHRHIRDELPFLLRVLWFFAVGWALGFLAIAVGYGLTLTIIGIPIGVYILSRVPLVTTLSQYYE